MSVFDEDDAAKQMGVLVENFRRSVCFWKMRAMTETTSSSLRLEMLRAIVTAKSAEEVGKAIDAAKKECLIDEI